jgi:hypothetical protein
MTINPLPASSHVIVRVWDKDYRKLGISRILNFKNFADEKNDEKVEKVKIYGEKKEEEETGLAKTPFPESASVIVQNSDKQIAENDKGILGLYY